jgi:hypothetical protein
MVRRLGFREVVVQPITQSRFFSRVSVRIPAALRGNQAARQNEDKPCQGHRPRGDLEPEAAACFVSSDIGSETLVL